MQRTLRRRETARSLILQELMIGQMVTVAGAFLINLLSARAMGPENRGEIALILQISYVVGVLVVAGRDRAALQADLGRGEPGRARGLLASMLLVPLCFIAAAGLAFAAWRSLFDGSTLMTVGFVLLLVGNLASRFFRAEAILEKRGRTFMIATVVGQLGLVVAGGSLLVSGISSVTPWLIIYGASLATPFLVLVIGRKGVASARAGRMQTAEVRRRGWGFLPSELLDMTVTKMDRLLLPMLGSYAVMGYYTVAASMVEFALMPFAQYVDSHIPRWAALHREGRLRVRPIIVKPLSIAVVVVAVVAAASYVALPLLFGTEYLPARRIVLVLALATLCHVLSVVAAGIATAIGSTLTLIRMQVAAIATSVPLLLLLIPALGAVGAASAQAAGFSASAVAGLVLVRNRLRRAALEAAG